MSKTKIVLIVAAVGLVGVWWSRLGKNPLLNARLAAATGYTGAFGHGEFAAWLAAQPDSTKAIVASITTAATATVAT